MKTIFKNILFAVIVLYGVKSFAQQDPAYTQYMYNMSLVNPAYASDDMGILKMGSLYRAQWAGIDGAPRTITLFAHTPINEKIETGINLVHDEIGDVVKETNFNADFAYKLMIDEKSTLSLGLKAGLSFFNADFTQVQLASGNASTDPAFAQIINETFPTIGIGAFYYTDKYYVGLSTPNLLANKHLEGQDGVKTLGAEATHLFLTAGYVLDIDTDFRFKPSFMLRGVKGAPCEVDINANILYQERFEAGIGYRFGDALTGLVNFEVSPGLRVGYAYDYTTSNLSKYSNGSHEIMVLFDLKIFNALSTNGNSKRFF
ncbi:MAG: hypothetical protein CL868_03755 [Cytophagaceae bacterium]|nr:hypothetical protein [Cytophagaceae bacterium]